jgi:uncharacterized repeat protein (TIGR01451 family)
MFSKAKSVVLTNSTGKLPATDTLNAKLKASLTILVAVLTITLWVGAERAHSESGSVAPPAVLAIPQVKLEDVPAEALIGEQFKFKVTFDNVGTGVGFGPFIDLVLPAHGKDDMTFGGPCDGISTNLDGIMVNVNGGPLPITAFKQLTSTCGTLGTTLAHPYAGNGVSAVSVPAGAQLLTLELPFGSFEPDQPKVEVEITVDLHNYADVGAANKLPIFARGGFRFGETELNDSMPDPPILTDGGIATSWLEKKDVIPTVFTVSKSYLGPEGEAVSGPNFVGYYPLRYQVSVNVAAGQTITQLLINDCLENNMTFVGVVNSLTTPGFANLVTAPCLSMTYPTVTGTTAPAEVVVTYEFYISQFLANTESPVLDPEACSNSTSTNKASASGLWKPLDPRDGTTPIAVSSAANFLLKDKHIAVQKLVKVKVLKKKTLVDKNALPIPGDYLEYRLRFQISDFFTFGQIEIEDLLSDGQELVQTAPAGPAVIRVTDQFGASQGKLSDSGPSPDLEFAKTAKVDCQGVPGGTRILFKVSQAMTNINSGAPRHSQGIMTGGHTFSPSSSVGAEGEIIFYVQIQDEFSFQSDKIKKFVDKHDPMNNCVVIRGRIYQNTAEKDPKPRENDDSVCSDDSSTSLMIKPDVLEKKIIARNDKAMTITSVPPQFAAADTITFSIKKTIPSGDWEDLKVRDWAPLPALDTNTLTFPATIPSCGGTFPNAGQVCLGPADDVGQPIGGMVHHADNSFTFDYGTQNNLANIPKTIELWFTLTLTNKPYADGLFFTNEAQECEFNTFGVKFCQVAVARFELTEPSLRITKGVVWAGNPEKNANAVFNPAQSAPLGVTFAGPNLPCSTRFAPTINSANLGNTISSDVSGVDAGDLILFAIVVENRGSGLNGAFDVKVRDVMPSALTVVSPVCVTYGDHTAILTSSPPPTLFLPQGLELSDSTSAGALGPRNASTAINGHNLAVITFYAQVAEKIPATCYPNNTLLLNYAATEGGPSFGSPAAFGGPFTDVASVCVLPKAEKCVATTSEPHTKPDNSIAPVPPQPPKVAIGEIVRYRLQVMIPEGVSTGFFITDSLPASMTYLPGTAKVMFKSDSGIVSNLPAVASLPGLQSKGFKLDCGGPKPSAILPASQVTPATFSVGTAPSFSLGTLQNNDVDPEPEYAVVEFNALVNNLATNVSALPNMDGVTLSNSFKVFIKGAPSPAATSNNTDVKILEPKLDVVKTVSPATVAPGGVVAFTVSVTNNGTTDAFDVEITDPMPSSSGLSLNGVPSVSSSCGSATFNTNTGVVTLAQMGVGCTVTETFKATVTANCPTASVINTAVATYTSLPGNGTPQGLNNTTGSVTPGVSGMPNGERKYSASGSVTVPIICTGSLTVTKTITSAPPFVPPSSTVFPITVSCSPSGPNVTLNLTAAGPTQTVSNIQVGSTCTVTEGALPPPIAHPACASLQWGTPTYSPSQTVSIQNSGSTATVQVNNTYFCNSGCASPPPNMVSWWPLNETSGNTVVDIKGGHNGTTSANIGSGPTSAIPPKVGNALFFANSKATVAGGPYNFGTGNFSIDAWVKGPVSNAALGIVDKLDTTVANPTGFSFFVRSGTLRLIMGNGSSTPATFTSTSAFPYNSWQHVAVTVQRTGVGSPIGRFYLNGVPAGTFVPPPQSVNNSVSLLLGSHRLNLGVCSSCEVSLDEIEIFNEALTPNAIKSMVQADKNGKCRAVVNGMKFNDLNGNGVQDSGEPGLAGWTIKVTDSNGNIQTTTTDLVGNYSFTVPAPGSYTISEVQQAGWTQTSPTSGTYSVTVTQGGVVIRNFGNKQSPKCELKIEKKMKPNPLISGQQATATITVTNLGTTPCHGPTKVVESTPPGLTPISASVTGGGCVLGTGVCTYPPAISAGASVVFSYVFQVNAQPGANIENCARLIPTEDTDPTNNNVCIPLTVIGIKSNSSTSMAVDTSKARR